MIQDIAPHTYDPVFRNKEPEDRDYVLHYEYNKVMLMRPVSYTHLDVYKRQAYRCGKPDIQLKCNNSDFYTECAGGIIQEGGTDGRSFCGPDEPVRV